MHRKENIVPVLFATTFYFIFLDKGSKYELGTNTNPVQSPTKSIPHPTKCITNTVTSDNNVTQIHKFSSKSCRILTNTCEDPTIDYGEAYKIWLLGPGWPLIWIEAKANNTWSGQS